MKILTILIFSLFSCSLLAQSTFTTTFHIEDDFIAPEFYKIQQTNDGGFIIMGLHSFAQPWVYMIKVDKEGKKQWDLLREPFEGGSFLVGERGMDMVEIDGEYIVLGVTAYLTEHLRSTVLFHLDATTGAINDNYELEPLRGAFCNRMIQTEDGNLGIIGYKRDSSGAPNVMNFLKTSTEGETQWLQKYDTTAISSAMAVDQGGILQDSAGDFYLAGGGRNPEDGWRKLSLLKTDAEGNLLWIYQDDHSDQARSIEKGDSGIFVTTDRFGNRDDVLIKTSFEGEQLWTKDFEDEFTSAIRCVTNSEGGIYIIGTNFTNLIVIHLDYKGELIWKKKHQLFGEDTRLGVSNAIITADDGFAMVGQAYVGTGTWYDGVFITHLNSEGEFGDILNTVNITPSNFDIKVFPNPASNQLTIRNEAQQWKSYHIRLIDTKGVVHHESNMEGQQEVLDIKNIPSGTYILELRTDNNQILHKTIVKE